ncbi:MAG: FG-GAP repeat protein, partial [Myxococcota bacterium]
PGVDPSGSPDDTSADTPTPHTSDTAAPPDDPFRVPEVRLIGQWSLQAGWFLGFDQLDGDPQLELLVSETRNHEWPYGYTPQERVTVVEDDATSGRVTARGWTLAASATDGLNELERFGNFGIGVRADPANGAILIGAATNTDAFDVASFPYPADHVLGPADALGTVRGSYFSLLHSWMGTLDLPRGRFLWCGTYETVGDYAFAGQVYLFDLPLLGAHDERDARASYRADPGDYVQFGLVDDGDLDGDGVHDLVFGAHARNGGLGAIAVLSDPPDGEQRIWDLAVATFDGDVPEGRLGEQLATGDLDGDGQADLLTGAAMVYGSATFHAFRGPTEGEHLASASDWTLPGDDGLERLGVSSAAGDLDGDGDDDLVVGAPANPALGVVDGRVWLFSGPLPPGAYTTDDAAFQVRNRQAPGTGDFFGVFLRTGDLTGDGALELAIAAPDDVHLGRTVGSVQILFGRSDLFEP